MKNIYTSLLMILLLSCSTGPKPAPVWVEIQPVSADRWYGIGISRITKKSDYRESARNKAYDEIGSQIKVQLQSELTTMEKEVNFNVEEYSESVIHSRVELSLPEVKIKDTFTEGERYYVLAQLIKEDYNRIIRLKKQKALNTAIDFVITADKSMSAESFNFLDKALKEIQPFADFPLEVSYPPNSLKTVNLFSLLHIKAQEFNNRIIIEPDIKDLSTTIGIKGDNAISVKCTDKLTGKPIADLPLIAAMGNNELTSTTVTNLDGKASLHLFRVTDKSPVQYLSVSVDFSKMITGRSAFKFTDIAHARIKVNARQPIVYMLINERNLNRKIDNPYIMPAFKEFFVERFGAEFTMNESDSDFIIKADINTTAKSKSINEYGLFQTYGDGTISIINRKTGKELYQKSMNNIMGADFTSLEGAGRNALKKMVKMLDESIFQEIISGLDSN